MNLDQERDRFEQAALERFVNQRAAGVQITDDNGSEPTREALFWRDSAGNYGVKMFNAAWWGWRTGVEQTAEQLLEVIDHKNTFINTLVQDRDEWKEATIAANQNASCEEKRRLAMQDERDTLRAALLKTQETLKQFYDGGYDRGECWMAGGIINAALANTGVCQHRFMHFGDQLRRRCADCNQVELVNGGVRDATPT